MANEEIISLVNKKIPTVVSYDAINSKLVIGEIAKAEGLSNHTNIFNFKMDLGAGDKEFREKKKYWYAVTSGNNIVNYERFSAKEVIKFFLSELVSNIDEIPDRLIIGEPAVRDQSWRDNFKKHLREVLKELGFKNIDFFFEPFAVFQYYRHYEKHFPVVQKPESILVIDIGGGTFNSCLIQTKSDGNLSRGGANMLPLGLQGEPCGGGAIDLELLKIIVDKARKRGVFWKDDPIERVKSTSVLFRVEAAKVQLSEQISQDTLISKQIGNIKVLVNLPRGTLHQDEEIEEELTGEDLKTVIRKMWRRHYGEIITKTINEAQTKLGSEIKKIDRVIIAGGSSKLPFTKEEVACVLPTLVNKNDVFIGNDLGNSVAYGIACECRELVKTKKYHDLTAGRIAPCLLNDLYIGFKKERHGIIYIPKINGVKADGRIFSAPFETKDTSLSCTIEMPFEPDVRMFYYFSDRPFEDEDFSVLNLTHDIFNIPCNGKVSKSVDINIEIKRNGSIKPTFNFRGKGNEAKKEPCIVECPEFFLDEMNVKEGDSYIGIDFGTSNSYLAKLFCSQTDEKKDQQHDQSIPDFSLKRDTVENLRKLEIRLNGLKEINTLSKNVVIENAKNDKLLMIFHSNKIEGNPLSKGETQNAISLKEQTKLTVPQKEAVNLDNAFNWIIEHLESVVDDPESFVRNINKIILDGVKSGGGTYRTSPVTISGMKFVPPSALSLPLHMKTLSDEIKKGPEGRSVIEFVTVVHAKLVMIHPFVDGNGRTARLYMNALLLHHELPSVIVNFDDKQRYFDALIDANTGDLTGFVGYLIECVDYEISKIENKFANKIDDKPDAQISKNNGSKYSELIGSKLVQTLETKSVAIKAKKIQEYEAWSNCYDEILKSIEIFVDTFNSIDEYKELGISLKLIKYDMLLFDKYDELSKGNAVPRTWYFRFDVASGTNYEKIMFFFQQSSSKIRSLTNSFKVSLGIARFDGTSFRRIDFEPVNLLEIGLIGNHPVSRLKSEEIIKGDLNITIGDMLLSDIIIAYF